MKPTTIIRQLRKLTTSINHFEYGGEDESFVSDALLDLAQQITEALDHIEDNIEEDTAEVRSITLDEFHQMTDEELEKTIDPCWRGAFPGKDCCTNNGMFYLYDGGYYNFLTGQTEGWRD